jgi:hypothetical protein
VPVLKPLTGFEAAARLGPAARIQASDIRNTLIESSETKRNEGTMKTCVTRV